MTTYTITVTRDNTHWLADVDGHAGIHAFAGSLPSLDQEIREAIAAFYDLPEGSESDLKLRWDYSHCAPQVQQAAQFAAHRRAVLDLKAAAQEQLSDHVRRLRETYSVRDTGALLGITPGRVAQLSHDNKHTVENHSASGNPAYTT